MSPFDIRKAKALDLLRGTGLRESNYKPPLLALLWRVGLHVPPPHFMSFFGAVAVYGSSFAAIWGVSMWLMLWQHQDKSLGAIGISVAMAGLLFGMGMACYYEWGRRKHGLPAWKDLA